MVVGFSETLARLIQAWTRLESSIGAVARVKRSVCETEREESAGRAAHVSRTLRGGHSDAELILALERVSLWPLAAEQGGLDKEMDAAAWSSRWPKATLLFRPSRSCRY